MLLEHGSIMAARRGSTQQPAYQVVLEDHRRILSRAYQPRCYQNHPLARALCWRHVRLGQDLVISGRPLTDMGDDVLQRAAGDMPVARLRTRCRREVGIEGAVPQVVVDPPREGTWPRS